MTFLTDNLAYNMFLSLGLSGLGIAQMNTEEKLAAKTRNNNDATWVKIVVEHDFNRKIRGK